MPEYDVTFLRTESITMRLRARNERDARERFLSDGDEIEARTLDLTVTDVENTQ